MRFVLPFLLLATAAGLAQQPPAANLTATGIPPIPQALVERTNQYLNVRSAAFLDWDRSGDGIYIATRFGSTVQVHAVDAPGAARRQITFFDEPVASAASDPRPGRSGFLFSKDIGGGEFYQMYSFDRGTGNWTLLTDGSSRNEGLGWSHAGAMVAFASNRRNKKDTDVWIVDPAAPDKAWALTAREGSWYPVAWSPDDRRLIVSRFVSANESHPYIADIATRTLAPLVKDTARRVSYDEMGWSRDGGTVYYLSDESGDFQHLFALDLRSGAARDLTPDLAWNVATMRVSRNGRYLAYTVEEDGLSTLHLRELPGMKPLRVPAMPAGIIGGLSFDPRDRRLAMTINAATGPGDVYVLDLASRALVRWTESEVGGLDTKRFVAPTLIHYPTFDSAAGSPRMIPAFLYMPRQAAGKVPVIIQIHGGPEGQSRPGFSTNFQYWTGELGCAVLDPNVRGSTGYGKTYLAMDDGYRRENSVRDIGALLDWIARQPRLDASRVAVIGGSYGGYMVLASLVRFGDRIRCGVDNVGISNFVTFLQNTESYRRDLRRAEYGDERDPAMRDFLERISPLTNAGRIRSPLFVVQGENDPRVPAGEARQIAAAVQQNSVPVWTLFAKDEGHGFQKKANRDYYMRAVILFFQEYLLQ
jgi:dipeptidyl aminopeptidase/acylaminoacyl peptidase